MSFTGCSNGDVRLKYDKTPMIFWDGLWSPICGRWFWDNQFGATKFCQRLGYQSGKVLGRGSGETYSSNSFKVGTCNKNDDWTNCRGGGNDYKLVEGCVKGQPVKITIACSGGSTALTSSCPGI